MSYFDIFDFASQLAGLVAGLPAEQDHLRAGGGGVSDEMNSFGFDRGQKTDSQGTAPTDVISKGAG